MPDPITIQVIRNALIAAAKEMQTTLVKTAHNPLIYEVQDFGVAMTNAKGELIAEGSGLPGFLACIPPSIQAGLRQIGAENLRDGTTDPSTQATVSASAPPAAAAGACLKSVLANALKRI